MDGPHLVYPFIHRWAFGLLLLSATVNNAVVHNDVQVCAPVLPLSFGVTLRQRYCPHFTGDETGPRRSDLQKAVLLVSGDVAREDTATASLTASIPRLHPTCYVHSASVLALDSKCLSGQSLLHRQL